MIIESKKLVKNPKVSVVIVTYNQVQYIEETINSVLRQNTGFPFEIIVADDGSNDGERDLLKTIQQKHPELLRLIFNDKNMKVTRNCFNGFMKARGEYIALLAGDDIWIDNQKLSKQVHILDMDREISVVLTGYQKLYEDTGEFEKIDAWKSPLTKRYGKNALEDVLEEHFSFFPVGSSILFRTKEIQEYYLNASKIINSENAPGEGMPIFTHFAMIGRYYFMTDITTAYRIRKRSLCHIDDKQKQECFNIKYAFQKINIAEYYNLKGYLRKGSIKLILLYLHAIHKRTDTLFLEELSILAVKEDSQNIKKAVRVIRHLARFPHTCYLLSRMWAIRNKILKRI